MIKVEHWSHGGDCWQYHGHYESEQDFKDYITEGGYDMRYFRIVESD